MKKTFWILSGVFCAVLLFGSGLLVGRQFPAHHYEKIPESPFLFDSSTGHVCDTLILEVEKQEAERQVPQTAPTSPDNLSFFLGRISIPPCN
jgi:hypothetical protein